MFALYAQLITRSFLAAQIYILKYTQITYKLTQSR